MNERRKIVEQIRQQSYNARGNALKEKAKNSFANAPIVAHGASGGGGGSLCNTKTNGITMNVKSLSGDIYLFTYVYDPQGDPEDFIEAYIGIGSQTAIFFDNTLEIWYFVFFGDVFEILGYSEDLISTNWILEEGANLISIESVCGTAIRNQYPYYCFEFTEGKESFSLGGTPFWSDTVGGTPAGWNVGPVIFTWDGSGWSFYEPEFGNVPIPGGTADALPIGTIEVAPGTTLTISEGNCPV